MTPSEPSPGGVAEALARAARAQPEAPFLFYRNSRGHFRWWSFATAFAFLEYDGVQGEKLSVKGVVVEPEAVALLGNFLNAAAAEEASPAASVAFPAPEPGASRDVWISWRLAYDPAERFLARCAIHSGAAILVDPASALHPELVAWARPTILSGTVEELLALAAELESLVPRLFRGLWLRQRGRRLRLLLVEGDPSATDLARLRARWRQLSPHFAPRVEALGLGTLV